MLNFIYYPVSAILWFWHQAFGWVFGPASGVAWALSVIFLVFTLRAILFKPFVSQVRSMRKMQQFAPEIQKLKKKHGNDKQKLAAEMQKLQSEHGVNPLGGCLPVLIQVPVFIGLFHVLRSFDRPFMSPEQNRLTPNYVFGADQVQSFLDSNLLGAKLGSWVTQGQEKLEAAGTSITNMLIVMIPLMIAAGIFTHITARHSVARQTEAQAGSGQTAIMNKLMLYVFPIGVVVGAPFLPLAILLYWVANNLWTLGQQWLVYKRIGEEEAAKKQQVTEARQARAPRPGQKPTVAKAVEKPDGLKPGQKPIQRGSSTPAKPNAPAKPIPQDAVPVVDAVPVEEAPAGNTADRTNGSVKKAAADGSSPKTNGAGKGANSNGQSKAGVRQTAVKRGRKRR